MELLIKNVYFYFTTNSVFGKILVLELWAEMLSTNQIAGFFKNEENDEVYF